MSQFLEILKTNPVGLLSQDALESKEPLSAVKTYFDEVINLNKNNGNSKTTLDEIVVDGLDANQVWWQSKIILDNVQGDIMEKIAELKVDNENDMSEESSGDEDDASNVENSNEMSADEAPVSEESAIEEEEEEAENEELVLDEEQQFSEPEPLELHEKEEDKLENESDSEPDDQFVEAQESPQAIEDKFGVNDQFFNLDEFNRQTLEAENRSQDADEEDEDDEEVDYFADVPSEEDEEALYYDDFFDKPSNKKSSQDRRPGPSKKAEAEEDESFDESEYDDAMEEAKLDLFADEDDDFQGSDEETAEQPLSTFERQQLELKRQIESLEKEAVAEKKWALKGEVKARDRPEDALLTEDLEFERTAKPVPVITAEVTQTLENMIRRRIKEEDFNDLQRRVISDISGYNNKPRFELSDVKSSKSLAEIYEDDFKGVTEDTEISEELQKSHDEISELYKDLVYKLDALSSAHFIPKPIKKDLEVRVQTAAISMEDAQPLTMSSGSTLAPQEIYKVGKSENSNEITLKNGVVMSRDELSREDKNRLRRAAKRKRSKLSAKRAEQPRKKSKTDDVLNTLTKSKNITVIDKKGAKTDVKGNIKKDNASGNINFKL